MIDAVIGDIASAMPLSTGTTHIMTYQYDVCGAEALNRASRSRGQHPASNVRCAPKRAPSRGVKRCDDEHDRAPSGAGAAPGPSGLLPSTSWKYCVMRNITPYIATNTRIIPPVPVLNAGLRK